MSGKKFSCILHGIDRLYHEGDGTHLKAKLEIKGFLSLNPNVANEPIEFWSGKEFLGEAKTMGTSGIADLQLPPLPIGNHSFHLVLKKNSRYAAQPSTLTISVIQKKHPILISDIDHTILNAGYLEALIKKNDKLKPHPGAPETLDLLSKKFQIVYLTSREEFLTNKTRRWLQLQGFPIGPIFFWDLLGKSVPMGHAKYKMKLISKLKSQFPSIQIGIGDRVGDAKAYIENNIKAVILPSKDQDYPSQAIMVKDWKEIRTLLLSS